MLAQIKYNVIAQGDKTKGLSYVEINGSQDSIDKVLANNPGAAVTIYIPLKHYVPATHREVKI